MQWSPRQRTGDDDDDDDVDDVSDDVSDDDVVETDKRDRYVTGDSDDDTASPCLGI